MGDRTDLEGRSTRSRRNSNPSGRSARDLQPWRYEDKQTGLLAGSALSRGICRYLKVSLWHSDAWHSIPRKGHARLVYLHILTGPHTLAYHVPGLYQVGQRALQEVLDLGRREFGVAIRVLAAGIGLQVDVRKSMIWAPSAIDHLGPPANPNIVRGYCRALRTMPQGPLTLQAIAAYEPFLKSLGREFVEPFWKAFPEQFAEPKAIESNEAVPGRTPAAEQRYGARDSMEDGRRRTTSERPLQQIGSILRSFQ